MEDVGLSGDLSHSQSFGNDGVTRCSMTTSTDKSEQNNTSDLVLVETSCTLNCGLSAREFQNYTGHKAPVLKPWQTDDALVATSVQPPTDLNASSGSVELPYSRDNADRIAKVAIHGRPAVHCKNRICNEPSPSSLLESTEGLYHEYPGHLSINLKEGWCFDHRHTALFKAVESVSQQSNKQQLGNLLQGVPIDCCGTLTPQKDFQEFSIPKNVSGFPPCLPELYGQELCQTKSQQQVLKQKISHESLPNSCLHQYTKLPPEDRGNNKRSSERMNRLGGISGKDTTFIEKEETIKRKLLPSVDRLGKTDYRQAGFVRSEVMRDKHGVIYEFGRRKQKPNLQKVNPDLSNRADAIVCEPCKLPVMVTNSGSNGMSLHRWLRKPGRMVDKFDCLHIFKQILEVIYHRHMQKIVLRRVRPSSFILSSLYHVSFLDSASSRLSSSSSDPSADAVSVDFQRSVPKEGRPISPAEVTAQQRRYVGLHSVEGEMEPSTKGITDLHATSRTEVGFNELELGSGILDTGYMTQLSDSSSVGVLGGLGVSERHWRFPPAHTVLASVKSDKCEERLMKGSMQLPLEVNYKPDVHFPMRQILLMEETWYASPEEVLGGICSFASDMYSLGVLFFELFCPFSSWEEHNRMMSDMRHHILPSWLLSDFPKEAAFCLWLLHPEPKLRPKVREVLQSELLCEVDKALAERQTALNIEEKDEELELLSNFLNQMEHRKQELANKLAQDVHCLTSDIEELKRRQATVQQKGIVSVEVGESSGKFAQDYQALLLEDRSAQEFERMSGPMGECSLIECRKRKADGESDMMKMQEESQMKSTLLKSNFERLEQVYFAMRWKLCPKVSNNAGLFLRYNGEHQTVATKAIGPGSGGCWVGQAKEEDRLGCFFNSLCKYSRYTKFVVKATLRHGDLLNTANMVCSLSFDRDQEYFATAGVCKHIKVFECDAVFNNIADIHYPVVEMTSRSKLSCVCWNGYIKSHIASSDYDGIVQLWDANTGQSLIEYEGHEKRIWSVDFCHADPTKLASGSDDGFVKLWNINQGGSIGAIQAKANVCCVQFPPDSAHLITFGSADYKIYHYDLRNTRIPRCILESHIKSVSYVKFVDAMTLVSASTDSTLKLWDLSKDISADGINKACILTFMGHTNEKNFVGLSVMDGYIACGSETNSVFVYHKSLPMPMVSHKFGCRDPISGEEIEEDAGQFVSSVCWRGKTQTLVAANSMGNIKVLEMV